MTVTSISNLAIGSAIAGTGIPPGAEVATITSGTPNTVTITIATLQGNSGTLNFNNSGTTNDNNGTLIRDAGGDCYYKTNYHGDPREWGAIGDGHNDDTAALQDWLGAYGTVPTLPALGPTYPPANYGPWVATVPSTYKTQQPLICPPNAVLQGGGTISSLAGSPPVQIVAGGTFSDSQGLGLPALMTAQSYCRISGIALNAQGLGNYYQPPTSGSVMGTTVTLSTAPGTAPTEGMPITDDSHLLYPGTTIINASGVTLTISQAAKNNGSGNFTITGFYAVDVAGTHVGIDNHSLIENGYYNVYCSDGTQNGLQVKDAQIASAYDTGIYLTGQCTSIRLTGDLIDSNGSDGSGGGVYFNGSDLTLANGIIEENAGPGLAVKQATRVVMTGMAFADNATGSGQTASITFDNSTDATFCGNRVQGGGSTSTTSSVYLLSDTVDNLTLCGNTYTAKTDNVLLYLPQYIYDITQNGSSPFITNFHLYETPEQPPYSVFTTAALPVLQPSQVPQYTQGDFNGLTLQNGSTDQSVNVLTGVAADSTNSSLIQIPSAGCTVNLAASTNGPGGLDANSIAPSTTYFIYAIAAGVPEPSASVPSTSCIASTSPTAPAFTGSGFSGTGYLTTATGGTSTTTPANLVYNASPLAGVRVGQAIYSTDGAIPSGTTVMGFSANSGPVAGSITGSWSGSSTSITVTGGSTTSVSFGMGIVDYNTSPSPCIPGGTVVTNIVGSTITISNPTSCGGSGALAISGERQLVLSQNSTITEAAAPIKVSTAYYRLLGAVYTNSNMSHPKIVPFVQNGNTYYLDTPVTDINTTTLGTGGTTFALSVPNGIVVKAFGRCVGGVSTAGGTPVFLYTPTIPLPTPANFPTAPGFSVKLTTTGTAFPYRLHTNASAQINAVSSTSSGTLYCTTDGWEFNP